MVSVLGMPADYPSAVLYGPPPPLPLSRPLQPPPLPLQQQPQGGNKFQQRSAAFYARSPPQRSNSTAAAAVLHLRSQSVPEAVYLEQQQQQQIGLPLVLQQRTSPTKQLRVMHYGLHGGHLHPPPPPPPPAAHQGNGGLRRSHTNATEFAASRRRFQSGAAKLGVSYLVQQQQQRQFGSSQHLNAAPELSSFFPPPPPMPAMPLAGHLAGFQPDPEQQPRSYIPHSQQHQQPRNLSRSRSNVASLRPNPLPPPPPPQQPFQHSRNPLYTRSTSQLFRQDLEFPASFSATSRGCSSLQMLLLQQPLHVDCSIEYDLGKQPLIPAGSEPLLIVDPAYRDPIQSMQFFLPFG